ncbi:glycosyltransferase family 4 protein [Arenibacter algicola]|uniref:glycosyltransferase family 4 protein n=1 Tax=Arenibacter algicola TaxID=616991 RepID=UPI001C07ED4C|nr:glycosyltransferase family 4 protein [Arenibacter algicola]MBU2904287.1 glycosyltransferase family 4 protein [Arenibacter algicola]
MKKIIFLALYFSNSDEGGIYTDLLREMRDNGEDVLVVAPSINEESGLSVVNGIKVLRVKTPKVLNVGVIAKGIANILLPYLFKNAVKKSKISLNFDAIILPTPPITLGFLAKWLKRKSKAKVYLILRDIFPQNAVDLKMINQGGMVYKYFRRMEKQLYATADNIGCMSQANIDYIVQHNPDINTNKLHLLPNWQKLPSQNTAVIDAKFKNKYGLDNKFVIIFGGNIGKPQKMENIVALAKSLTEHKDIIFFIIGDGTEKTKLESSISKEGLDNIIVKGRIPREDYNQLILAADVGLISLSEDFTIPNFPSKVLSYFASSIPVLASVDVHTDFGKMLQETNSGFWSEAGNTEDLKNKLLQLYHNSDLRKTMGENGHEHMKEHLLPLHAYKTISNYI